jgi:biopolymer transport protein TolR
VAQGSFDNDDEGITGINVTPLVDVTLVLLIVFMVTASYIVKETISVELPRAAHGGETVQKTFAVLVTKDDQAFLNGIAVDDDGLLQAVRQAKANGEDVQAIIGGDKRASHGAVTHVLDVLKGAGVTRFAIQIEKQQ